MGTELELHEFTLSITAESEGQAQEKLEALAKITEALSHDDLVSIALNIEKYPKMIPLIKNVIANPPEGVMGWYNVYQEVTKEVASW